MATPPAPAAGEDRFAVGDPLPGPVDAVLDPVRPRLADRAVRDGLVEAILRFIRPLLRIEIATRPAGMGGPNLVTTGLHGFLDRIGVRPVDRAIGHQLVEHLAEQVVAALPILGGLTGFGVLLIPVALVLRPGQADRRDGRQEQRPCDDGDTESESGHPLLLLHENREPGMVKAEVRDGRIVLGQMCTTPRPAPDIAALFDRDGVVAHELIGPGDESLLHPEELLGISHATEKRRQEFAAGRMCARAGLAALDLAIDRPLVTAEDRSPIWPDDATGSISHTAGYCVAAVAPRGGSHPAVGVGLGIDAEQLGRVTDNLHRVVFTAEERAWLDELSAEERSDVATTLFSAKEAFYKAQHPLTLSWVGFQDVTGVRSGDGLVLRAATDLDALHRLAWPQTVAVARRDRIVVTAVQVRTS